MPQSALSKMMQLSCLGESQDPTQACSRRQSLSPLADEVQAFCLGQDCALPLWQKEASHYRLETRGQGWQGLLLYPPVKGHFTGEIQIELPAEGRPPRGLIAFPAQRNPEGRLEPDLRHYVALVADRDERGFLRMRVRDRQPSPRGGYDQEQLLDRTQVLDSWERDLRYQAVLDGSFGHGEGSRNDFQVPFTHSDGRMRIFHHSRSQFGEANEAEMQSAFYLSYGVHKQLIPNEDPVAGWMSLAPLASWRPSEEEYFLGFVVEAPHAGEKLGFEAKEPEKSPASEAEEGSDGFRIITRPYSWSGFTGEAVQVQFGENFPASSRYRLVFWTEMNNVPAWHINDQLLLSYSFIELWPQNRWRSPGCFEAMSDDMLWNNRVTVLADHPARKIIHWRSFLFNPAYQTIAETLGRAPESVRGLSQLARSDEYWTIYPDGSSFRHIIYTPDSEGLGADSFEIAELSVIAGTLTRPEDHAVPGATLEMWNPLSTEAYRFRPSGGRDIEGHSHPKGAAPYDLWPQAVAVVKLKDGEQDAPLIYGAFRQDNAASSLQQKTFFDISWHGYEWEFSHWPVHREAYEFHDKSLADWPAEVSHAALASVQIKSGGRSPQPKEFISLVGMHHDPQAISARVQDWMAPPDLTHLQGCSEPTYNSAQGDISLRWQGPSCQFRISPRHEPHSTQALALQLKGVPEGANLQLKVNGRLLSKEHWALGWEGSASSRAAVLYIPAQSGGFRDLQISTSL